MFKFIHVKKKEKHWRNNDNVVLGVSLHNPNLTGDRFLKVIDWVNEQPNFKRCYIDFADTLNRHNYMLIDGIDESAAYDKAHKFGKKWLQTNQKHLDTLNIPYQILHWDRWLKNPMFFERFQKLKDVYQSYKPFKKAVDSSIQEFFNRRGVNASHILPKEYFHSVNFILEEIAVDTVIYDSMKAAYVYPAKEMDAYKMIRANKVPQLFFGLSNSYYVRLLATQYIKQEGDKLTSAEKKVA